MTTSKVEKMMQSIKDIALKKAAQRLDDRGERIIKEVLAHKPYSGFTGNAQLSYSIATYRNGGCEDIIFAQGGSPVSEKVKFNETVFLSAPFEGRPRSVAGKVEIGEPYSVDTVATIASRKPTFDFYNLRFMVGAEYNDFIGNPIGDMHLLAKSIKVK